MRMRPRDRSAVRVLPAALCTALAGCGIDDFGVSPDAGSDAGTQTLRDVCNPMDEQACLLPWPSSIYLEDDPDTETGLRVSLPESAMPTNQNGTTIEPAPYNRRDGFPAAGPLLASFPTGVSAEGLPPHWDIGASLAEDAPIVLLDMESGERQPYFAEVDANQLSSETYRALIIRPAVRLDPGTRYAVAIRDSVRGAGGESLPSPAAFAAIRDGETPRHPRAQAAEERYDAMFSALEGVGVAREELVLAWDFVTASDASLTRDLRSMRDQAVSAMSSDGEVLSFDLEEEESDDAQALRLVSGTYVAPNFLTNGEEDNSVIIRDGDEVPLRDGTYEANLSAVVPACAEESEEPLPVVIFGHGLFGSASQHLSLSQLIGFADDSCHVFIGSDWIGLTRRQLPVAAQAAGNGNRLPWVAEKLAQGVVNFIALGALVRGPLGDSPLFQQGGESILDPDRVRYFGISLGGIMGGVFMAYDPEIERGALGVPGGPWGLLLERSHAWNAFQGPLFNAYGDQLTYQVAIALMGMVFEAYDPATTASRVLDDPIAGTPPKKLLLYQAVGDSLVSNLATGLLARSMDVPVTGPSVAKPFGLEVTMDAEPSALTIYDQDREPLPPETNIPPSEDNGTHVDVNMLGAVFRQLEVFFEEGIVQQECRVDGAPAPCDCATGACD